VHAAPVEGTVSWLHQAVPAMNGLTPTSMLVEGNIDGVLGVLATHASGVYV
jgi:hypothetical protein